MKVLLLSALLGAAAAYPLADNDAPNPYAPPPPPPPKYAPAPPPYAPPPPKASYAPKPRPYAPPPKAYKEEVHPPQPYQFEYGVSDQYTGANFKAAETQDEKGTVLGEYSVNLPDGRVQTVTYRADEYGGFVADVRYEGEAVYPPEPAEGYGNTYKKYTKEGPSYRRPAPPKYEPAPPPPKYEPGPPKYNN